MTENAQIALPLIDLIRLEAFMLAVAASLPRALVLIKISYVYIYAVNYEAATYYVFLMTVFVVLVNSG